MNYIKRYQFNNSKKLKIISDFLESKENYILETYPYLSDFGTKLTTEHVSTRSGGYNIFHMNNECPELDDLLKFFKDSYYDYLDNVLPNKTFSNDSLDPGINCWLNVLRESENIGIHRHANDYGDFWSFVSGTFVLRAKNTTTNYKNNDETCKIENIDGEMTIFPPYYYHWTDVHQDETSRLTLGFDFLFRREHAIGDKDFHDNLVGL